MFINISVNDLQASIEGATLPAGSYDALGNQAYLPDPLGGAFTAVYLDQGHIAKLMDGASTEWRYYYDADGMRRIKAAGPSGLANASFTFYAGNDLICQLDRGSQVQGNDAYTPKFLLTDHLGTTRAELTFDASKTPQVMKTYDYMPYGEEIAPATTLTEQVKFTGKQRDTESGLDFFGARYYCNTLFRWTSPDEPLIDIDFSNPRTWNRYVYVQGNPVRLTDPNGRVAAVAIGGVVITAIVLTVITVAVVTNPKTQELAHKVVDTFGQGVKAIRDDISTAVKSLARPGTIGKPDHRETVKEEAERIGGKPEVTIKTPEGAKASRRADAARLVDGKPVEIVQVYRPTPAGNIPKREQDAARDIEQATGVKPQMVPVRPLNNTVKALMDMPK